MIWDILTAKKDQVEAFRVELAKTAQKELAGAAPGDYFWRIGLSMEQTKLTLKDKWPGTNKLGSILTSLREQPKTAPKPRSDEQ